MNLTMLQYVVSNGMLLNCMFKFDKHFGVNGYDFVERWDFVDMHVWMRYSGYTCRYSGYLDLNEMIRRHRFEWDVFDIQVWMRYSGYPGLNEVFWI